MSVPSSTIRDAHSPVGPHRARHSMRQAWLVSALCLASGCGQSPPPATVEGTLRLNGEPLDNCLITFLPEPDQEPVRPHSTGVTDRRGYYRLRLADQREGASVGRHRVIVQDLSVSMGVRRRDHGTVDQKTDQAVLKARPSRVPARHRTPATTPLKQETSPGPQVIGLDVR